MDSGYDRTRPSEGRDLMEQDSLGLGGGGLDLNLNHILGTVWYSILQYSLFDVCPSSCTVQYIEFAKAQPNGIVALL